MLRPLTLENEHLALQLWPGFGGKVSSIIDKADRTELLFNYPAELPTTAVYDIPYAQGWYAGWDECLPGIAAGPYAGRPYDGIGVPDHGEIWGLQAPTTPTKSGALTTWHGIRFGYRFQRQLTLDGPTLIAEYEIANLAPVEFRFVWAQHALLSMPDDVTLDLPRETWRLSHDSAGQESGQPLETADPVAFRAIGKPATLPAGGGWKLYAEAPIAAPAVVRYPNRKRHLSIAYDSTDGVDAYWGVWINTGGWSGHRHLAIEPTTGRHDQLDRSIRDRSAATLPANATASWQTRWTVGG